MENVVARSFLVLIMLGYVNQASLATIHRRTERSLGELLAGSDVFENRQDNAEHGMHGTIPARQFKLASFFNARAFPFFFPWFSFIRPILSTASESQFVQDIVERNSEVEPKGDDRSEALGPNIEAETNVELPEALFGGEEPEEMGQEPENVVDIFESATEETPNSDWSSEVPERETLFEQEGNGELNTELYEPTETDDQDGFIQSDDSLFSEALQDGFEGAGTEDLNAESSDVSNSLLDDFATATSSQETEMVVGSESENLFDTVEQKSIADKVGEHSFENVEDSDAWSEEGLPLNGHFERVEPVSETNTETNDFIIFRPEDVI